MPIHNARQMKRARGRHFLTLSTGSSAMSVSFFSPPAWEKALGVSVLSDFQSVEI